MKNNGMAMGVKTRIIYGALAVMTINNWTPYRS